MPTTTTHLGLTKPDLQQETGWDQQLNDNFDVIDEAIATASSTPGPKGDPGTQGDPGLKGDPGTPGTIAPRGNVLLNTPTLANQASDTGVVALGKAFAIISISMNLPCRIRLYSSVAFRDADLTRGPTTSLPINSQHGCILDLIIDTTMGLTFPLTWVLSPLAYGADVDGGPDGNIAYTVQNLSGGSSSIQLTFSRTLEEQ
jgi:hypothetical protein